jgi:hypothetical protein
LGKSERDNRDWDRRRSIERLHSNAQQKIKSVREVLSRRTPRATQETVLRPGASSGIAQRFSTTTSPHDWITLDRSRPAIDAVFDAVEDGQDRVVLAWPNRPGSAFILAALALREARTSGRLSHATLGYWPWRDGALWSARSVLVNPADVSSTASSIWNALENKPRWAEQQLAHASISLIEMRLRDLAVSSSTLSDLRDMVVKNPTLLETTMVFPPHNSSGSASYLGDEKQILRRVRAHTLIGEKNAGLNEHFLRAANPSFAPYAVFGLTASSAVKPLSRQLNCSRFMQLGLDAIVVDATRSSRRSIPDGWERRLSTLLDALAALTGRRPPIVVMSDEASAARSATRTIKTHSASQRHKRTPPLELGLYTPSVGFIGPCEPIPTDLPLLNFDVDIKDASLAAIRHSAVELGRAIKSQGDPRSADSVAEALSFLRRSASLPIGLYEASSIADIIFDGDDSADAAVRSLFKPKMCLSGLATLSQGGGRFSAEARALLKQISEKVDRWSDDTAVSAKLSTLLATTEWNSKSTLLALPDKRTVEIFLSSDRAMQINCAVCDHKELSSALPNNNPRRLLVLGFTPEAMRALLITQVALDRVTIIGDAAGTGLILSELAPLRKLKAFSNINKRVQDLETALTRGGANEKLDIAESQFRMAEIREGEIDLTQSGDHYSGPKLRFKTSSGRTIAYRPNSDVLLFTAGEIRPFARATAQQVSVGERILVLRESVREPLTRALAGSKQALEQLLIYHEHISNIFQRLPGATSTEKARGVVNAMQQIDPKVSGEELQNVLRWITAHQGPLGENGQRQPRAARDWARFKVFMSALGVSTELQWTYWRIAIVPTRSYRAREGYQFNQRVVQFVLDPEGYAIGSSAWDSRHGLWQLVLDAVEEITEIRRGE